MVLASVARKEVDKHDGNNAPGNESVWTVRLSIHICKYQADWFTLAVLSAVHDDHASGLFGIFSQG